MNRVHENPPKQNPPLVKKTTKAHFTFAKKHLSDSQDILKIWPEETKAEICGRCALCFNRCKNDIAFDKEEHHTNSHTSFSSVMLTQAPPPLNGFKKTKLSWWE